MVPDVAFCSTPGLERGGRAGALLKPQNSRYRAIGVAGEVARATTPDPSNMLPILHAARLTGSEPKEKGPHKPSGHGDTPHTAGQPSCIHARAGISQHKSHLYAHSIYMQLVRTQKRARPPAIISQALCAPSSCRPARDSRAARHARRLPCGPARRAASAARCGRAPSASGRCFIMIITSGARQRRTSAHSGEGRSERGGGRG
jgi:hypothetical protein